MIKINRCRQKSAEIFTLYDKVVTPYEALKVLAIHELGCGGEILSVGMGRGQTIIKVKTCVYDNIDIVTFSGDVSDMEVLIHFLGCYATVSKSLGLDQDFPNIVSGNIVINPDLVSVITGLNAVFYALMVLAELNSAEEVELAQSLVFNTNRMFHSGLNELIDAIEIYLDEAITFEEACEKIGGVGGFLEV